MIKLSYNSTLYSYDGNTEVAITNASKLGIEIHSQITDLSSANLIYEQEGVGAQSVALIDNLASIPGVNLKSGPLTLYLQIEGKLSNGFTVRITKLATPSGLVDDDPVFTVDRDRRIITIPDTQAILAVVRDTNSEIIKFKFPRYADGVDLSTKTAYVNFVNAAGNAYKSLLSAPQIDGDYVLVSWIVGKYVTVQEGNVLFQVEFFSKDYRWQTQIAQLSVVKSLEAEASEPLQDQTLLEEYLVRFNELIASATGGISATARELLITVLRNGVYSSDQSANITNLEAALSGSGGSGGDSGGDTPVGPDEPTGEASLPTDGLLDFFDFRNAEPTIDTYRGLTSYTGMNGGSLFAWSATIGNTTNDYGSTVNRSLLYDKSGATTQTFLGNNATAIVHAYVTAKSFGSMLNHFVLTNMNALGSSRPKYVNTSDTIADLPAGNSDIPETGLEYPQYINMIISTDETNMYYYVNGELVATRSASEVEDFVSWSNGVGLNVTHRENLVVTACAVYEKTLSEVEITESIAYFKTLEVSA